MADGILTAGGGHQWENELVGAVSSPGSTLAVIRRCVDVAEVLAVAGTGQAVSWGRRPVRDRPPHARRDLFEQRCVGVRVDPNQHTFIVLFYFK